MIFARINFDSVSAGGLYFETHAQLDRYIRNRRNLALELIVIQWREATVAELAAKRRRQELLWRARDRRWA